ncbi:MAG: HlyD family efflux transporter periplasmic adaptor subunit, partial [Burkholderiales bacterium]|nr:HlyD family efflux transporter periplasmic adaptor subunit [Anaerolineae bacterium]
LLAVIFVGLPSLLPMPPGGAGGFPGAAGAQTSNVTPEETYMVSLSELSVGLNATGSLEANDQLTLNFETSAPVVEVLVSAGQTVRAGDVLARLETIDAEANLRTAEIALTEAQADLEELVAPPRDIDVRVAEATVNTAQAGINAAYSDRPTGNEVEIERIESELARNQLWQTQLNRDITLQNPPEFRGNDAYAQEVELEANARAGERDVEIADVNYADIQDDGPNGSALGSANAQLASAQAELNRLIDGPSDEELRRAEIDIESALLDIDSAQADLQDATLVAPLDGVIANEDLEIGAYPPADGALTLIDSSAFTIDLLIDENDIANVQLGQVVDLNVDALPDADITGTITKIEAAPTAVGQLVTYAVEVTLNPTDAHLRVGMSATATVVTEALTGVITVPNRFIRIDDVTQQTLVTVQTSEGTYQDQPVTLGVRNSTESQIVSGLQAGQTIALLPRTEEAAGGGLFPPAPGGGAQGGF